MYLIRKYRTSDSQTIVQITITCFQGVSIDQNIEKRFGRIGEHTWQERKMRHVEKDLAENPDGVFVAEVDDTPIGYITTRLDRDTRIGWIPHMAVLPDYQKMGIGKHLIETALE